MQIVMLEVIAELLPQGPDIRPDETELRELFLSLWPDQEANLGSYISKPDCSCRGNLQKAMVADGTRLGTFLAAIHRLRGKTFDRPSSGDSMEQPQHPSVPLGNPQAVRPTPLRHLQGQTRDIDDTPEAYAILLRDLQKQGLRYTGLTLHAIGEHRLRVYFY